MTRWLFVGAVLAIVVAAVAYDQVEHAPQEASSTPVAPTITPVLPNPPRLTSDWYCPVGSADADGFANHRVAVSNLSSEPAVATLEVLTDSGPGPSLRFDLDAESTELVELSSLTSASPAGAMVEIIGGEGIVGHEVVTAAGVAQGPCSTATSGTWFFASGSTTRDTRHFLALMNPSPDDVVFSAEFQTSARTRKPGDLQSAVVPARSVRLIDVGEFVAREELIATKIETVVGRLVVERLMTFDGSLGPVGAALQLAVADASPRWIFPAGRLSAAADNRLVVANPGSAVAEVDVFLDPADPADRASYGLVPIELTVAPGRSVELDLVDLATQIGLPLPYELGLRVVSANDVAVIAERWQLAPMIDRSLIGAGGTSARVLPRLQDGGDEEVPLEELDEPAPPVALVQPTADRGTSTTRGVELSSTRWVVPWVTLVPDGGTVLVVTGGPEAARIEARVMVGGMMLPPIRAVVDADGRTIIALTTPAAAAPVVITSDTPIVVDAQVVIPGQRLDVVPAVPSAMS